MSFSRSAGILLPISSLPSKYGIGTLGKEAYRFVDFLVRARQSYWQILPIGHTSYGDSPYQCFSSFAGNPYFIDLDFLAEEGYLSRKDLKDIRVEDEGCVDYGYLYSYRYELLYKAYRNGYEKHRRELDSFRRENRWLEDYALFMAIKKHFRNRSWLEWPDQDIRLRNEEALSRYRKMLKDDVLFYEFIQFLFFRQYFRLKDYANEKGIRIIGDLPIYIAMDSCEVWAKSEEFRLDQENKMPREVAGVPPDYFSKTGQLWGNPLYDWDHMKSNGYRWWIERIGGVSRCFDVIRIDHFRGFEEYWAVPYGDKNAKKGHWVKGPSTDFIAVLRDWFTGVDFIAEDLGIISEEVVELLKVSGFPGMRVLEFGMAYDGSSYHSPHNHIVNSVCYTSTHDNSPIMGWVENAKPKDLEYAKLYYGLNEEEGYNYGFIRAGMDSVSVLFIAQMQDYLGLGNEATMNNPGTLGNWGWRLLKGQADEKLARKIAGLTRMCSRDRKKIEK